MRDPVPRPAPPRGGASAGPRPPRVRVLCRAARDGDPAGGLPARQRAARPSASSPSGSRSRGRRCARRWPHCGRPASWRPRRGRGGGTVVTLKPRHAVRPGGRTDHGGPPPGLAGRARLPPHRRARGRRAGGLPRSWTTYVWPSSGGRTTTSPRPASRPSTGRRTRGST